MYVYHKDKFPTYRCKPCKTKLQVDDIDAIYHEQLKTFLYTEKDLTIYLSQSNEELIAKEKLLNFNRENLHKIRKRMDELVTLRLDGEMNKESFAEQFKPLEIQREQIENQLPKLEAEIDFIKIENISADTALTEARDLYNKWDKMPFEEKRSIVEIITDKISIDNQDINIRLSYMPTPFLSQKAGKSERKRHNLGRGL